MFSINERFLNPDADIYLNKAAIGKQFAPLQPTLYLIFTLKKTVFNEKLRQSLLTALESFSILEFKILPLETKDIQIILELGTSHQPDTILTIIELIIGKSKNQASNN